MSQAEPDDPIDRSAPRVVLLATDRSQSIIGEIVGGQTKTIAYSAYGEQSAQQKVETQLGFNGQLREADIGWYLLGNGYRAYNPRLMRFHSPDSWSPFGNGGLNSYAYCLNEPINSEDPTGHAPIKILLKRFLAQQRTASVIVKNPNALQLKRQSVIVKNPKRSSPKVTQLATERNLAPPKIQIPVSDPIGTTRPPSLIIENDLYAATPSIPPSQPMISAAHSQAEMLQKMPQLKPMTNIYQQPLPRGKRKMPTLPISATEDQIKKIPQFNPIVLVRRS